MKISFTGLTIDSQDIPEKLSSEWRFPVDWERIVIDDAVFIDQDKIRAFANTHFKGRYMFYMAQDDGGYYSVVLFEQLNDAIMFKMLDGGKQCSC